MVESLQGQLAEARQEARELRQSMSEMDKGRQASWGQQLAAQTRMGELEGELSALRSANDVLTKRCEEAEQQAAEERSLRARGDNANAELMGKQASLLQRLEMLETELANRGSSKRRGGTRRVKLQDQPVESRPGTANLLRTGGDARPGTSGGLRGGGHARPSTSAVSSAHAHREERAGKMHGAQVLRIGEDGEEDEFETMLGDR